MDSFQLFEWKGWHRSFKWRLALRPAVWKRIICLSGIFNEQFSMNNLCNSSTWFKCGSSSTLCSLRWPSAHLMSYFFPSRWASFLSLFIGSPRWIFDVKMHRVKSLSCYRLKRSATRICPSIQWSYSIKHNRLSITCCSDFLLTSQQAKRTALSVVLDLDAVLNWIPSWTWLPFRPAV